MSQLPEIRIQDSYLLRENASQYLHELWGKGEHLADDEDIKKIVTSYQKAWKSFESKILPALTDLTGLSFRQNIIDVYIAPWFNAFSAPMVIGIMREPDQFVDTLTHELIHRLLTDNTSLDFETPLLTRWQKLYGKDHSFGMIVHIPVHAIHKAIYLDILKDPSRLKRDIAENTAAKTTDYMTAWEYVEAHGYKKIISQLKEDYKYGD
jgi:hypothetical protein